LYFKIPLFSGWVLQELVYRTFTPDQDLRKGIVSKVQEQGKKTYIVKISLITLFRKKLITYSEI
jgi:hypothetical protein